MPTQDPDITLGIRSIRELEPILRDLYHDVMADCTLCKMILLHVSLFAIFPFP